MKRSLILLFLFSFMLFNIFSESVYLGKKFFHTDEYETVCISENSIKFSDKIETGKLCIQQMFDYFEGKETNYIILNCKVSDTAFLYLIKDMKNKKYNYGSWEMTYSYSEKSNDYVGAKLVPFKVKKTDSFIIENNQFGEEIRFLPENGNLFFTGSNPWAVKKDDEKVIYLSTERWRNQKQQYMPVNDIVVINGFVFPGKEYLYEQNSRAKRLKLSYNDINFEVELQDSGNFQVIHLPTSIIPSLDNTLRIEVIDYYKGSKYSDIVISGIYYMDAQKK